MSLTLQDIAARLDATVEGDGAVEISGVAGLRDAQPGDITFLANPKYSSALESTRASAVILKKGVETSCDAARIRIENPDDAFAEVATWFAPEPYEPPSGLHPTAVVAEDAHVSDDVSMGPYCVVESGASIGEGTVLCSGCYVGASASIGRGCVIHTHVSIRDRSVIGNNVTIHNGVVVGSDGFGFVADDSGVRKKIPQIGIVVIGDDVEIGANSTIDRARFGKTRIGKGVKIDNLVQIAHNVVIGDHAVIVAQVGIAGSTVISEKAILAGQVGVSGHLVIGAGSIIGAQSGVSKDVPPKSFYFGTPAVPRKEWNKHHFHVTKVGELREQVAALESRLKSLEAQVGCSAD